MTKKLFYALMLGSLLALSLSGALAVIPHVHGDDMDHSRHSDCVLYQLSLSPLHAEAPSSPGMTPIPFFLLAIAILSGAAPSTVLTVPFGRAPPASL